MPSGGIIPPVVPPIPPGIPAPIREAVNRIRRHLLVKQALEYLRCRKAGKSLDECFGIYRVLPPHPEDPHLHELLERVDEREAAEILAAVRDDLATQLKAVEARMKGLKGKQSGRR